jgi:hypothetical protein
MQRTDRLEFVEEAQNQQLMNCCKNTYFSAAKTGAAAAANAAISLSKGERLQRCSMQHGEVGETTPAATNNKSDPDVRYWPLLADMPTLSHWPDRNQPFDHANSQVLTYVRDRFGISTDLANRVFDYARYKKVIRFDHDTKLWSGVKGGAA